MGILVQSSDRARQKKAYRILEEICSSKSDGCVAIIDEYKEEMARKLTVALSDTVASAKAVRKFSLPPNLVGFGTL